VAVGTIAGGTGGNTAESDLVEEVPFPGRLEAAVKEMGGVGEAGCGAIWRKIRRCVGRIGSTSRRRIGRRR
jgi:hypothetical protein